MVPINEQMEDDIDLALGMLRVQRCLTLVARRQRMLASRFR